MNVPYEELREGPIVTITAYEPGTRGHPPELAGRPIYSIHLTIVSHQEQPNPPYTTKSIQPLTTGCLSNLAIAVNNFASKVWFILQKLSCGANNVDVEEDAPAPQFSKGIPSSALRLPAEVTPCPTRGVPPAPPAFNQSLLSSALPNLNASTQATAAPPVFDDIKKEIVSQNPLRRLRHASSIEDRQEIGSESKVMQLKSAKFLSEFFMKSYTDAQISLGFQKSPAYKPGIDALNEKKAYGYENISFLDIKRQLIDLETMIDGSCSKDLSPEIPFLKAICSKIAGNTTFSLKDQRSFIGKLMLLLNADPHKILHALKSSEQEAISNTVDLFFQAHLNQIELKLEKIESQASKTTLQDHYRVKFVALVKELSKCLIPCEGVVNTGIIPDLTDKFFKEVGENNMSHLKSVLNTLLTSSSLRSKLTSLSNSGLPNSPSTNLIKIILDIPLQANIGSCEAQQAGLAALLSYCRQGKSGTCFASFLTIQLMSSNLELCIDDFACLLRNNNLTREIDGKTVQFPFRLSMSKERLNQAFLINSQGGILEGLSLIPKCYLWEAPGVIASCRALGLKNPQKSISKALALLKQKNDVPPQLNLVQNQEVKISLDDLLLALARIAHEKYIFADAQSLYLNAVMAFESQTYNPLLRVWENVIAGMAEGTENGFIKPQIIDSIMFAIERKLSHGVLEKAGLESKIGSRIKLELQKRIQLQFCPQITHQEADDDGNSQQGAFVVYDTKNSSISLQWERVDTAEKFQAFMQAMLKDLKFREYSEKDANAQSCQMILSNLIEYVSTADFIVQTIKKCGFYQPKNADKYENIDNTPWIFKTGTNPKKVLQTYFEMEQPPLLAAHILHDAKQLIEKIAEVTSNHLFWIDTCSKPHIRLPAGIQGVHVFSLIPNHPTLWPLIKTHGDVGKWLEEKTIEPGKKIASMIMPESSAQAIIKAYQNEIIVDENKSKFFEAAASLKKNLTITEFRNELLKIATISLIDKNPIAKITLDLDTLLFKNLPLELQKKLSASTIHIADTNWFDGCKDIHFCVVLNPGTEKLELWKVNEDNTNLTPIDQNYWLLGHPWEFYP